MNKKIEYRSLGKILLFTIITLGIYFFYWAVKTKEEIKSLGADIPTAWLLIIPFARLYFWYKYSEGFVEFVKKEPKNNSLNIGYTLLISFLPFIAMFIIQIDLNAIAKKRT